MWCRSIPFGHWRERRPTSCGTDIPSDSTHIGHAQPRTPSGSSRYAHPCCGFWLFSTGELGACRSPTESKRTENVGRDVRIVGDAWVYGRVSSRGLQTCLVVRSAHHARRRRALKNICIVDEKSQQVVERLNLLVALGLWEESLVPRTSASETRRQQPGCATPRNSTRPRTNSQHTPHTRTHFLLFSRVHDDSRQRW